MRLPSRRIALAENFLGILIMIVVLLLGTAYPLTNYVDQQREINTTRARIAELKQETCSFKLRKPGGKTMTMCVSRRAAVYSMWRRAIPRIQSPV